MKLRLLLLAWDALMWLRLDDTRLFWWVFRQACDATDWGNGADCSGGTGEPPF